MEHFTPWASLIGGVLIGLSALALLLFQGKIAGISGIVGGLLSPVPRDTLWRAAFVAGLVAGGLGVRWFSPEALSIDIVRSGGALALAGFLVGFGSRLGNGCTSGHGVCGIGRLSLRSLIATLTFILTGAAAVYLVRHLWGGVL